MNPTTVISSSASIIPAMCDPIETNSHTIPSTILPTSYIPDPPDVHALDPIMVQESSPVKKCYDASQEKMETQPLHNVPPNTDVLDTGSVISEALRVHDGLYDNTTNVYIGDATKTTTKLLVTDNLPNIQRYNDKAGVHYRQSSVSNELLLANKNADISSSQSVENRFVPSVKDDVHHINSEQNVVKLDDIQAEDRTLDESSRALTSQEDKLRKRQVRSKTRCFPSRLGHSVNKDATAMKSTVVSEAVCDTIVQSISKSENQQCVTRKSPPNWCLCVMRKLYLRHWWKSVQHQNYKVLKMMMHQTKWSV